MSARELVLLCALALLLVAPAINAAPAPTWSAKALITDVPQGTPVSVLVSGPPNGTFSMTLYAFPFNSSPPLVSGVFRLPAHASLPNNTAAGDYELNTTYLGVEPLLNEIQIAGGVTIAEFLVNITPAGGSIAALQSQLAADNLTIGLLSLRENALLGQQSQIELDYWIAVIYASCVSAVVIILVLFTRSSVGAASPARRLMAFWHDRTHSTDWVQNTGPWRLEPGRENPRAVARFECRHCHQTIGTAEETEAHCMRIEGVEEPELGVDYAVTTRGMAAKEAAIRDVARRRFPFAKEETDVPSLDLGLEE